MIALPVYHRALHTQLYECWRTTKPLVTTAYRYFILDRFGGAIAALRAGVVEACSQSGAMSRAWTGYGAEAVGRLFVGGATSFTAAGFATPILAADARNPGCSCSA